jgi:hypothetical protein
MWDQVKKERSAHIYDLCGKIKGRMQFRAHVSVLRSCRSWWSHKNQFSWCIRTSLRGVPCQIYSHEMQPIMLHEQNTQKRQLRVTEHAPSCGCAVDFRKCPFAWQLRDQHLQLSSQLWCHPCSQKKNKQIGKKNRMISYVLLYHYVQHGVDWLRCQGQRHQKDVYLQMTGTVSSCWWTDTKCDNHSHLQNAFVKYFGNCCTEPY